MRPQSKKSTTPVSSEYSAPTTRSPSSRISCSSTSEPCRSWLTDARTFARTACVEERSWSCLRLGRQQAFDGRPHAVDDRVQVPRLVRRGLAAAPRASPASRRSACARARRRAASRTARRRTRRCRSATARRCCPRRGSRTGRRGPDRTRARPARASPSSRGSPRSAAGRDDGHAPNAARELVDRVLTRDEAAIAVAQTLERVARRDHAVILCTRWPPDVGEYSRSPPFGTQRPARASVVATSMLKRTNR